VNLTKKQEAFCQAYINSDSASEAYRQCYDASRMKTATINVKASELLANGKVAVRVKELQEENKKRFEVTVDQKKAWLVEIVERSLQHEAVTDHDGSATGEYKFDASSAVRAINELNKMDGDHAPTKNEHTGKNGKPIQTESKVTNINFIAAGKK